MQGYDAAELGCSVILLLLIFIVLFFIYLFLMCVRAICQLVKGICKKKISTNNNKSDNASNRIWYIYMHISIIQYMSICDNIIIVAGTRRII